MQKFINILVVVLVATTLYYSVIVDYKRSTAMNELAQSDVELQGHKSVIDEEYRRITLKFDGRGKHIQQLQQNLAGLNQQLQNVTDSLGNQIDETNFAIRQIEEQLRADIRSLEGDLNGLSDEVSTNNRRVNRSILDMQEVLNTLESDLKALTEKEGSDKEKK